MLDGEARVAIYRPCSECNGSGEGDVKKSLPTGGLAVYRWTWVCGVCYGEKYWSSLVELRELKAYLKEGE